jgi:predicted RNase H-like HicB family nuclease
MSNEPTLRQYLSVPYRIEAQTLETQPGVWVRRAAYPELLGCTAEAATIEETLELLERRRIEIIVDLLRAGESPPLPRQPLRDCDPEGLMRRFGLHETLAPILGHTAQSFFGKTAMYAPSARHSE